MSIQNTTKKASIIIFLNLSFASAMSMLMLMARIIYSQQPYYFFLSWNLFLAWMPFLFARLAQTFHQKQWLLWAFGGLWLLFFPNAAYLITDMLHLQSIDPVPLWYDMLMLFSFILTGLFLGFVSLRLMQSLVLQRFGAVISWLFVVATLVLSSFGVYIGRFLRWNSWDVFLQPVHLLTDIGATLATPESLLKTAVITSLLTVVSIFTYILLCSLPHLSTQPEQYQRVEEEVIGEMRR
jgi:uncharacterized membrane protein